MNQIMRVGNGVIMAWEKPLRQDMYQHIADEWRHVMGGIPLFIVPEARIVEAEGDRPMIFEFTGDVTPTFIAEFKLWWENLTSASTLPGV